VGEALKPRLFDLFCGAGGCSVGYHRAGFEVVGIDIEPQPNYPFEFIKADAMQVLEDIAGKAEPWRGAPYPAAIHVSPPCQDHMHGGLPNVHGTGWMLAAAREQLELIGVPWVIENVPGAPMRADFQLCGSQFGLPVRRHRWFETSWHGFDLMPPCDHSRPVVGVYGHPHGDAGAWPGMLPGSLESWSAAMGIGWMTADELAQAIPPAYTELVGAQLLGHLVASRAA
jgi:DNA (cytosine-5)-methyltransferase 1